MIARNRRWNDEMVLEWTLGNLVDDVHFVGLKGCWTWPKVQRKCTFLKETSTFNRTTPGFGRTEAFLEVMGSSLHWAQRPLVGQRMNSKKLGFLVFSPESFGQLGTCGWCAFRGIEGLSNLTKSAQKMHILTEMGTFGWIEALLKVLGSSLHSAWRS